MRTTLATALLATAVSLTPAAPAAAGDRPTAPQQPAPAKPTAQPGAERQLLFSNFRLTWRENDPNSFRLDANTAGSRELVRGAHSLCEAAVQRGLPQQMRSGCSMVPLPQAEVIGSGYCVTYGFRFPSPGGQSTPGAAQSPAAGFNPMEIVQMSYYRGGFCH